MHIWTPNLWQWGQKEICSYVHQNKDKRFQSSIVIVKSWNQNKGPSAVQWIEKLYHGVLSRNENGWQKETRNNMGDSYKHLFSERS